MNRMQGWWLAAGAMMLAPLVQAQTAWAPLPAAAKSARPAQLAALDGLPPGSVSGYARGAQKAGAEWEFVLPDGQALRITGVHAQSHANGDVTWSGYVEGAGGDYPVLLTEGPDASFGSFSTPRGRYRLEGWGDRAWVVHEDHVQLQLPAIDEFALAPPAGSGGKQAAAKTPRPAPSAKADATQIDVLFIHDEALAARYPGSAVQTRMNHLAALATQAFANSNVNAAVRVAGVEQVAYSQANTNLAAIDDVRKAVQPNGNPVVGLLNLRRTRTERGADIVSFVRPHDLEVRGSCGVGYLYAETPNLGINVISDGISGWSVCRDETFAHELGHNLGLQHQDGANDGEAGSATAFVSPGKFHTLMGSFVTGDDDRARTLLRFSNPDQRCGGRPCGVNGASDNAGRARANKDEVAAFMETTGSTPAAVIPPPALDADVDGDGVKESEDAFPFDAAHSSDRDDDGVADGLDRFPDNALESADTDTDGTGDNADPDIDGDGVANADDALPRVVSETADADGDGVGDNADAFDGNRNEWADLDRDDIGDNADPDIDGDGGADTAGSDLLVVSTGTDRVLRLDGASGRFVAVEIAEPQDGPGAFGPMSELAWNAQRNRVEALVAGDVRRYDAATRKREAVVLESSRRPGVPGLRSGLSAAFTVAPDGTHFVADTNFKSLHRFDAITGAERTTYPYDRAAFVSAPRGLLWADGLLYAIDKTGRVFTVDANGAVQQLPPPVGQAGVPQPLDVTAFAMGADKQLYLADGQRDQVYRMEPQTGQLHAFVEPGSGGLDRPVALAFDAQGRLYASSANTNQVLRYSASGNFVDAFAKVPAGTLAGPGSLLFVPRVADRYPRDASRRIRPNAGAWYDPGKSGQGFDIQAMGNSLSVAWYTYDTDGRATWYLATGPLSGNSFFAPLQRFTWNGSTAVGATAGEVRLQFSASDRAQLDWRLGGQGGTQQLVHFQTADSVETQFPTGLWYAPATPGWGFSLTRQGSVQAVTAFVFDKAGNPTWVTSTAAAGTETFSMLHLASPGGCPGCNGGGAVNATVIGQAVFDVIDDTRAGGAIDLLGDNVEWRYAPLDLRRLSDTPTAVNGDPR